MKKIFAACRHGTRPLLTSLLLALLAAAPLSFAAVGRAGAAALAEEHTVLYYLVEMQRRFKKNCGGAEMPEAPSLHPSQRLRDLATQSVDSAQPLDLFAKANGLESIPFLGAKIPSQNAQDAFERLNAAQCANLMNPAYRYIGAARSGGDWILFMAGAEPEALPGTAASSGDTASQAPGAPLTVLSDPGQAPRSTSAEGPQGIAPSVATQSAIQDREAPAPTAAPSSGAAAVPSTTATPASPAATTSTPTSPAAVAATPTSPASPPPATPPDATSAARPGPAFSASNKPDPRPAPAVPVAVVPVDGTGKPTGKPQSLAPSLAPSTAPAPPPVTASPQKPLPVPPGGAGPLNDPAAPAAPVVVRELKVDHEGKVLLPGQPGARSGRSSPVPAVPAVPTAPAPAVPLAPAPLSSPQAPGLAPLPQAASSAYPAYPVHQGARGASPVPGAPAAEVARMLGLVNQSRAAGSYCGNQRMPAATPLRVNPAMAAVAQTQADAMTSGGYFSSTSPQGVTLGQRVSAAGYTWAFVAENIARVPPPVDSAVQSWMADPGQCVNLMSGNYVDAGIGYNGIGNIWVMTVATPMPGGTARALP